MSAERPLPSARQATCHGFARLTAAAWVAAMALSAGCRGGPDDYVVQVQDRAGYAPRRLVRLVRCESDWCETLAIGPTADGAQPMAALAPRERCSEIVWSPDGKRVGFVINGQQLRLYEAETHSTGGTGRSGAARQRPADQGGEGDHVFAERRGDHLRRLPAREIRVSASDLGSSLS